LNASAEQKYIICISNVYQKYYSILLTYFCFAFSLLLIYIGKRGGRVRGKWEQEGRVSDKKLTRNGIWKSCAVENLVQRAGESTRTSGER
jgi:hypothetical protein